MSKNEQSDFLDLTHSKLDSAKLIGSQIGPYKLLQQIGEGGMGTVYVAEQAAPVERRVALKVIKPGMDSNQVVARFEAERQALSMMEHPNIATVLDVGTTEAGRPYFVMELVKGVPITKYCDEKQLNLKQRLQLFKSVCGAVQHAHQKGIIHRDLKPSNILVAEYDDRPVAKVIDFGLAKALHQKLTDKTMFTQIGQIVGTLPYMSPEQSRMNELDADTRTDIYSLGVVLYELLTGTTPFDKQRLQSAALDQALRMIREEEPPKPSLRASSVESSAEIAASRGTEPKKLGSLLHGELDWITMKAIEKDRSRRYETANGFGMDVERYLNSEPILAAPPSATYRLKKFVRRNSVAVIAASLITSALVLGVVGTSYGLIRAVDAEADALEKANAAVLARLDADKQKMAAEERLVQIEKGNEILTSIFDDLDIDEINRKGDSLEIVLAERLVKAGNQLEEGLVGDPLAVAFMQGRLADSLKALGFPKESLSFQEKSYATLRDPKNRENVTTHFLKRIRLGLAQQYVGTGEAEKAIRLLEEYLKESKAGIRDSPPPNDSPEQSNENYTLEALNVLGQAYLYAGENEKALTILEKVHEGSKEVLGAAHPQTLIRKNNLANHYLMARRPDKAIPLYEEAVREYEGIAGLDHPTTLQMYTNLATCYRELGKYELALALFKKTLQKQIPKLGEDHPEVLGTKGMLAQLYDETDQPDLAIPLNEETLRLFKTKLGLKHPHTLTCMNNLALSYKKALRYQDSITLFEEAFQRHKDGPGMAHPSTFNCVYNFAETYIAARRFSDAESLLEQYLTFVREHYPEGSPLKGQRFAAIGHLFNQVQRFEDAAELLRESLNIRQATMPDDWRTFNTHSLLGESLAGREEYADAEMALLAGNHGLFERKDEVPPKSRKVRLSKSLERLIRLYEDWHVAEPAAGHDAKAVEWQKKLDELTEK